MREALLVKVDLKESFMTFAFPLCPEGNLATTKVLELLGATGELTFIYVYRFALWQNTFETIHSLCSSGYIPVKIEEDTIYAVESPMSKGMIWETNLGLHKTGEELMHAILKEEIKFIHELFPFHCIDRADEPEGIYVNTYRVFRKRTVYTANSEEDIIRYSPTKSKEKSFSFLILK